MPPLPHTGFVWRPQRWARVHCTPCTPYSYAADHYYYYHDIFCGVAHCRWSRRSHGNADSAHRSWCGPRPRHSDIRDRRHWRRHPVVRSSARHRLLIHVRQLTDHSSVAGRAALRLRVWRRRSSGSPSVAANIRTALRISKARRFR